MKNKMHSQNHAPYNIRFIVGIRCGKNYYTNGMLGRPPKSNHKINWSYKSFVAPTMGNNTNEPDLL